MLLHGNVFLGHKIVEVVLGVELLFEVFFDILVAFVLEVIDQLHPVTL
jgi:hypothetical protein